MKISRIAVLVLIVVIISFSLASANPTLADKVQLSRSPVNIDGEQYVLATDLAKLLNANCIYNPETKTVSIRKGYRSVDFTVNSKTALVNFRPVEIDRKIWLDQGKVVIPISLVAKALGYQVSFEDESIILTQNYFLWSKDYRIAFEPQSKWAAIILSEQRIYFYQGDWLYADYRCCTGRGKHGKDWKKYEDIYWVIRKQGEKAWSYTFNVPTPYKFFLSESPGGPYRLKAIHGFEEVPNHPASAGCIRMIIDEAKQIYPWVEIDMPVQVQLSREQLKPWRSLFSTN